MPKAEDYEKHYAILDNAANALERLEGPDVDKIAPLINEGLASLKFCQSRILEVRAQVEEAKNLSRQAD
jgi:hypothetical protein